MKYAEVVSSSESMTMVLCILGGHCTTIEAPMSIFPNENKSYLIQGLVDDNLEIFYRTRPKDWIDQTIFLEYFLEPRVCQANLYQHMKII